MPKTDKVIRAITHLSISNYGYKPLQIPLFGCSNKRGL
jgi:hypothetical protein